MDVDDVVGAAFLPTDGQANPSDITLALAKGARMQGVDPARTRRPYRHRASQSGRVTAVETEPRPHRLRGRRALRRPVDARARRAGRRQRAARLGPAPVHGHRADRRRDADLPTLRDPDRLTYYKEEVGGLVMGGYEPNPIPWAIDGIPKGFDFQLLDADWDHFEPMMELALGRVPALADGRRQAADQRPGELHARRQLHPRRGAGAAAASSSAPASTPSASPPAAAPAWRWPNGSPSGEPPYDLWPVDIRRFGRNHRDTDWVRTRTLEAYAQALHDGLAVRGARERPPAAALAALRPAEGARRLLRREARLGAPELVRRAGRDADGPLHLRPAELVRGRRPRAPRRARGGRRCSTRPRSPSSCSSAATPRRALSWICANDVAQARRQPHLHADAQRARRHRVRPHRRARLRPTAFYIVTGTGFATHDFDWIRRTHPRRARRASRRRHLRLRGAAPDGPERPRDVLATVTADDVSNAGFPVRPLPAPSRSPARRSIALRVTYVGELGWELHVPVEFAATVYDALHGGRAPSSASSMPATAPSRACAWRRATAPGAPTSARTTRRSRPASAGR